MKKLLSLMLTVGMLLSLAACASGEPETTESHAQTTAKPESSEAPVAEMTSYTYTFQGMMGEETAQIDLYSDGTCQFYLPGHPMITDVYAGTYTRDGAAVAIRGLTNVDTSSAYTVPGLWDWIVEGSATVTVDESGTFLPAGVNAAADSDEASEGDGLTNISYASGSGAQVCDIYLPEEGENWPVILLVHGGGFLFGDQRMAVIRPVIHKALENGYAVVSVDYRKSSESLFPGALADVKAAVRFVRAHAAEYGWNGESIAVWGESAGAYLALMTALTPGVAELNSDVTDYDGIRSDVRALVSFYAPVEWYTMYEEAGKPESATGSFETKFLGTDITGNRELTYTTYWETYSDQLPGDLKAWIQAGDADQKVPYTQSVNFADRLAGYLGEGNVTHSIIAGADHEDDLFYTDENLDAVFAWLEGFMK